MNATIVPLPRRRQTSPAITSNPTVLQAYCARIEVVFERGFRGPGLVDLQPTLRSLPLLVQCAYRVHAQREAHRPLIFSFALEPTRAVIVALGQQLVLVFSRGGVLAAAGDLVMAPDRPVAPGARWTRIDWAADVTKRDWY